MNDEKNKAHRACSSMRIEATHFISENRNNEEICTGKDQFSPTRREDNVFPFIQPWKGMWDDKDEIKDQLLDYKEW